jgi:acetyl/propionyl-CoA carboxylase alpha subunit
MAIRRILIANRGEIATRIISTCRALDIEAVLAVSSADRDGEPARQADRVVCIGPSAALRNSLQQAAVRFAGRLGFRGARTVEFIVDSQRGAFYFLEMNARIQVEHPVTEAGASHG